MIKFLAVLLAAVLLIGRPGSAADEPQDVITFGVSVDTAPFSSRNESGEWSGYTVDICKEIFRDYSSQIIKSDPARAPRLEWRGVRANERFSLLKSGEIQALCGPTTVTVERMRDHSFTLLTFASGGGVMRDQKHTADFGPLLNPKDAEDSPTVAVVGGTTTVERVNELLGTAVKVTEYPTHSAAFQALQDEEVLFYFGDRAILAAKAAADPGRFVVTRGFLSYEPYAVAIHQDNRDLLFSANSTLARLYREGAMARILQNHLGSASMSGLLQAMFQLMKIPAGR